MSHFTVLVVTDTKNGDELDKALQPFHEYECTGVKDEYVKLVDYTDEVVEKWEKMPQREKQEYGYETIQQMAEDYFGYEEYSVVMENDTWAESEAPEAQKKFMRLTNPNDKWDWWAVGGRWNAFFTGKDGLAYNVIQKKDIDYAAKETAILKARTERLTQYCEAKGDNVLIPWKDYSEKDLALKSSIVDAVRDEWVAKQYEVTPEEANRLEITLDLLRDGFEVAQQKAREEYRSQPGMKAVDEALKLWRCPVEIFEDPDYLKVTKRDVLGTFAILENGNWHEEAKMGWFACVSDANPDWDQHWESTYDAIPEDKYVWIVDCHI